MPYESTPLRDPLYWAIGLAIFCIGLFAGWILGRGHLHFTNWRAGLGMVLIFAGVLAMPPRIAESPSSTVQTRATTLPADGDGQSLSVTSNRARVLVDKQTLSAQTALTADNVEFREFPPDAVQPNAEINLADVLGKALIVPVGEGQQILATSLADVEKPDVIKLVSPMQVAAGEIIATGISPTNTKVGETINISITVKNTSDKPLQTMGPEPGFTYLQGQAFFTQHFASDPGTWRVAVGTVGLDSTDLPYRWGLGGDLAPGASTTVSGHIKVTQYFKPTNFWAALVNEPSTVVQSGVGMTLVTSLPQNPAVVAVDAANVRSSPSISASVVDQVKHGTELQIVGQSADWFKVKLPDQREGWVAAGWIVTAGQ